MGNWLRKLRGDAAFTASGAALVLSALAFGLTFWDRRSKRKRLGLPTGTPAAARVTRKGSK